MPKRILSGQVVSGSEKTIKVKVKRSFIHSLYRKVITRSKNYIVHDANNAFVEGKLSLGSKVDIEEHRPISKRKRWILLESSEA